MTSEGDVRITFPDPEDPEAVDVCGMGETCALDVADAGPAPTARIGALLGLEPNRVNVIAERVMARIANTMEAYR